MSEVDDAIYSAYRSFLQGAAGQDLVARLKMTEAKYMMEGMKASTVEQKGLAMERMHAIYLVRTMLDDLARPKVAQVQSKSAKNQSNAQAGS